MILHRGTVEKIKEATKKYHEIGKNTKYDIRKTQFVIDFYQNRSSMEVLWNIPFETMTEAQNSIKSLIVTVHQGQILDIL